MQCIVSGNVSLLECESDYEIPHCWNKTKGGLLIDILLLTIKAFHSLYMVCQMAA